jgi:glycosyltransferase involved in cell wall biosynthesis
MPFFSIVMPTLNRANLLPQTIASIEAQTFQDYEILLVDGGSTDNTRELAPTLSPRLRLIAQPADRRGIAAQRSTGFMEARGEYVACLDSDDIMFPWALQHYYEAIQKHDRPGFVMSDAVMFHDDAHLPAAHDGQMQTRAFRDFLEFIRLPRKGWVLASGSVFKAQHAREVAGQSDAIVYAEDTDMFLRLGDKPGFVRIDAPLCFGYRQHDANVSTDFTRLLKGMGQLIDEEVADTYPGGPQNAKARRQAITSQVRSAAKRCLKRGMVAEGWELYRRTAWWNAQVGRWDFVLGYPAMLATCPLRRKQFPPTPAKPDTSAETESEAVSQS